MSKSRSGAPKRVAAGLLAGALGVFGLALAPPAGAVDDTTTDRYAGATRYGTAAAVAGQTDFDGATTAILATGENYPDALAASGLAGTNAPSPIVLTESNNLTDETRVALAELGSLDDVIIVGGTAAVSDDVATAVEDEGYSVSRLAGENRYETAHMIGDEVAGGQIDGFDTALIASGEVFADALAGGPIAYALGLPVLLVNTEGIPATTSEFLTEQNIEQVVILGGTARITDETETELEGIVGNDAIRVAGVDRFETSTLIADFATAELGWPPEEALLASGLNFPDALAAGPLGGERSAPILLTASLTDVVKAWFDAHSSVLRRVNCIGGTASCSVEDLAEAERQSEITDNDAPSGGDTQTSDLQGPELQSAAITGVDIEELAISYTFTFDQQLDEDDTNPELFKLYNADTNNPATGDVFNDGEDMEIDGDTAIVVFNLIDYGVANATLAAVEEDAVSDDNGNGNPAQSVTASGIGNSAGTGVVSARIVDEDDGIVEIEYGAPQAPGGGVGNLYQLIMKEGYVFSGTPADAAEGFGEASANNHPDEDELSTTVRVQFLCNGDNTPAQYGDDATDDDDETDNDPCSGKDDDEGADLSDESVRRLAVISLTSGRINTADISSGGTTDGPDLVGVEFPSDNEDLEDNQALFLFDEDIATASTSPAAATAYKLAYSHCSPTAGFVAADALDAADAGDTDEEYEDMDGQGFQDDVDAAGSCLLSGDSVDLGSEVDEDEFTEREMLVTFDANVDDFDNDFVVAAQVGASAFLLTGDADIDDDDAPTVENQADEVELGRQPASVYDDGEVYGPQLVSAVVELDTGFGGDFEAWKLILTFDTDIDDIGAVAGVRYFYDDGENVESDDLTCETDDDDTVSCEVTDSDSDFANAKVVSIDAGGVMTDDTFTVSDADENIQFMNPEASISIEVPEAPEEEE